MITKKTIQGVTVVVGLISLGTLNTSLTTNTWKQDTSPRFIDSISLSSSILPWYAAWLVAFRHKKAISLSMMICQRGENAIWLSKTPSSQHPSKHILGQNRYIESVHGFLSTLNTEAVLQNLTVILSESLVIWPA